MAPAKKSKGGRRKTDALGTLKRPRQETSDSEPESASDKDEDTSSQKVMPASPNTHFEAVRRNSAAVERSLTKQVCDPASRARAGDANNQAAAAGHRAVREALADIFKSADDPEDAGAGAAGGTARILYGHLMGGSRVSERDALIQNHNLLRDVKRNIFTAIYDSREDENGDVLPADLEEIQRSVQVLAGATGLAIRNQLIMMELLEKILKETRAAVPAAAAATNNATPRSDEPLCQGKSSDLFTAAKKFYGNASILSKRVGRVIFFPRAPARASETRYPLTCYSAEDNQTWFLKKFDMSHFDRRRVLVHGLLNRRGGAASLNGFLNKIYKAATDARLKNVAKASVKFINEGSQVGFFLDGGNKRARCPEEIEESVEQEKVSDLRHLLLGAAPSVKNVSFPYNDPSECALLVLKVLTGTAITTYLESGQTFNSPIADTVSDRLTWAEVPVAFDRGDVTLLQWRDILEASQISAQFLVAVMYVLNVKCGVLSKTENGVKFRADEAHKKNIRSCWIFLQKTDFGIDLYTGGRTLDEVNADYEAL